MPYERDPNGVLIRSDGRGDAWANAHRNPSTLDPANYMQDMDGFFGCVVFAANTGDRLFIEYEPDAYKNANSPMRRFAVVAVFDRKDSEETAFSGGNWLSSNFYRYICRALGEKQPIAPRFFFVVGGQKAPWTLIELNLDAGIEIGRWTLDSAEWSGIWKAIGLSQLRSELLRWITREGAEVKQGE